MIQRDRRLAQARKLVPERLLVADVTAPSASAAQFVGALAPLLPPRAAAAAAARLANGTLEPDTFKFYQMQDARYLEALSDAASLIATRSSNVTSKLWWVDASR